ncbi:Fanconi anemia core complex-associated protein 100 isoform 2-T2 [Lycaon pictus]
MASPAPRVDYLAAFRCPLGGPAAGKPHVLCRGAELFVSTGRELVYVYDQEGRLLTAAYRLPGQVWHLELSRPRRTLYVLCARKGIYGLALGQASRSVSQGDGADRDSEDSANGEPPCTVIPVDPEACILPNTTLCAFTVVDNMLVTLAQGPARWKVQLFECPRPGNDARPGGQVGEVELSTSSPLAGTLGEPAAPRSLPVLCCVSPPGSSALHSHVRGSGGFTLEQALFGLLFGVDASLLESPVIVCGLPDGQLCCVVLKTLVTSRLSPGDPKALVKILHHLEEPVVFIGALKTQSSAEDTHPDCLVALGHHGRILAIRASWAEVGNLVSDLRECRLPGPVLCAACGAGGRVYYSTPSELCVVDLAAGGAPWKPEQPDGGPGGLPSPLCPTSLGICSVVTLSVLSEMPEGGARLLALSAGGRLMICSLALTSDAPCPGRATVANSGQKIKELLCDIGTVSERVSSLKKAVDQRNKTLTCLNEAMNVLTSSQAPDPDVAGSATTYTIPVDQLGPGDRREVTLPLGPGEDGALDLPVTVSCALHYSLREVVGEALAPSESFKDSCLDEGLPAVLPEQDGICLPLSEHTVDLLQCLRFPGLAAPHTQAASLLGPACDPVDTFLGALLGPHGEPAGPASLWAKFLPPSVATIKVSAELLRAALGPSHSATSLCCATLQWLLAENTALEAVRTRPLSSIQGVAPDGTEVHLTIREVTVTQVCAAGPLQAVEIQVESSSLATLCKAHHAVIGRLQRMVVQQAAQSCSPPDIRVQYLRQIHANHEALLQEVQTLRDRLCTEDEASSCTTAERLLQVYRQLRSPSLLLV